VHIYRENDGFILSGKFVILCEPLRNTQDDASTERYLVLASGFSSASDAEKALRSLKPFLGLSALSRSSLVRLSKAMREYKSNHSADLPPLCALALCSYGDALQEALGSFPPPRVFADSKGNTALHLAIQPIDMGPSLRCINVLLSHPPTHALINAHNEKGETPLTLLASQRSTDHLPMVRATQAIIQGGASLEEKNKAGLTPALAACQHDNRGMLKELREAGARMDAVKDGLNALHVAAQNNAPRCIEFLLSAPVTLPVDRETVGAEPKTALWLAVLAGHVQAAEALLRHGADPRARGPAGNTAMHAAASSAKASLAAVPLLTLSPHLLAAENARGDTPLDVAIEAQNACFVRMVFEQGPHVFCSIPLSPKVLAASQSTDACRRWVLEILVEQLRRGGPGATPLPCMHASVCVCVCVCVWVHGFVCVCV
jgi:ankyrin repeat protein